MSAQAYETCTLLISIVAPAQSDFDKSPALKDVPIALKRIDIHAEWVSPKVLEMMGDLPMEVPGGQIIRDENGKPTGVFVRDCPGWVSQPIRD
jgi:predicted amidohydrolase YtcJ